MHAVGLPVPAVLQYHEWKGHEYLLLTAVPGTDASVPRPPDRHDAIVSALATAMQTLHATNISACPFDQTRRVRVAAAEVRARAGVVREDDFDAVRQRKSCTPSSSLPRRRPRSDGSRTVTSACLTCSSSTTVAPDFA